MNYYAHKRGDCCEPIIEHLYRSADKAEAFGNKFGLGKLTRRNALCHDIAKRTMRFQDVLDRKEIKINHAACGAQVMYELSGHSASKADLMSYDSVYGHHSSLGFPQNFFGNSIKRKQALSIPKVFDKPGIDEKRPAFSSEAEFMDAVEYAKSMHLYYDIDLPELDSMDNAELMLIRRLVHSCLVDADYSATAEFEDPSLKIEERFMDAAKMLEAVKARKREFDKQYTETKIQKLRNAVYSECLRGKVLSTGLYTLTAPTGLGKTMAAMAFAVSHALKNGQKRIFIVLPFLTITAQSFDFYKKMFEGIGVDYVIEDDSNSRENELSGSSVRMYTDRWNAPVVVTTSVKFFETLMSSNTPSLRKLHQVANSIVIFDESQTLQADILDVTMNTLKALPKYCNTTVLLSTATQPEYKIRSAVRAEFHEVIEDPVSLYRQYAEAKNTRVKFIPKALDYKELASYAADKTSALVVMNTIGKARKMFKAMQEVTDPDDCLLLTSQLSVVHKRERIKAIQDRLKEGRRCILVSTQCIEAGADLDFSFGMREIAPWTSIVQTAGRINRNCDGDGEFIIFKTEDGFPDTTYRNLAMATEYILGRHPDIDLYGLDVIQEYYREYFGSISTADSVEIRDAEASNDIYKLDQNYNLIENRDQSTVLVSYGWQGNKSEPSFEGFVNKLRRTDFRISKKEMILFRKYGVNITNGGETAKMIKRVCRRLYTYGPEAIPLNWYIDIDQCAYDERTGLKTDISEVNKKNDEYIL